jgi:adenine/guanine phosphoribosyltransferase-like PRPP-binding protein
MKHEETTVTQHEDDYVLLQEERHYVQTINAFVELIVMYGWDKVVGDLRSAMGEKQW